MKRAVKRYGWKPDLPDKRDLKFVHGLRVEGLPTSMDLRPQCPEEVYDQGQLGSCTANSIAGAIEFDMLRQGVAKVTTPSRLFIYFNERAIEGSVSTDSGAQIRDGVKSCVVFGATPETEWPYSDADPGPYQTEPSQRVFEDALKTRVSKYERVPQTLADMKACLASGSPFVFGFTVYESFESDDVANTGVVPMPGANEQVLGGHAVLAVGYDDATQRFIVRNSWGPGWGMSGYFTMPYAYLTDSDLADDFWRIDTVTS